MPDKKVHKLPRGIWYEESKKRYRVRLYRNNVSYLGGYFSELNAALEVLDKLREKLSKIKKVRRTDGGDNEPYELSTAGHLGALNEAGVRDPRIKRHKTR